MTHYLRLEAFRATPLVSEPFAHLIVPDFIGREALAAINAAYPDISAAGSFPVDQVTFGPAFAALLDELRATNFARRSRKSLRSISRAGRP